MKTLLIFLFPAITFAENLPLQVILGQTYKVPFKVSKASISDRTLIKAEEKNGYLYLKPLRKGGTTLKLDDSVYTFQSITPEAFKLSKSFKKKTLWIGIDQDFKLGELTFSGNLHMLQFYRDMVKRAATYNSTFVLEANMSDELRKQILSEALAELKKHRLANPGLTSDLTVTINTESVNYSAYQKVLGSLGIRVITKNPSTSSNPVIRTKITILELQKSISQKWGILWEGKYKAEVSPYGRLPTNLEVEIQALENDGKARVLASPNLLCKSGSEAEFLAGGEFPIKISSFHEKDIVWKKFGVFLKVKPVVDANQKIQLALETEISQITGLVENLPTMSTNKVSSHFDVTNGKTVILSGLLQSSTWKSDQGIMGLKDIPVLGNLFKSTDFQNRRSELVILVKPEIENTDEDLNLENPIEHLNQMQIIKD